MFASITIHTINVAFFILIDKPDREKDLRISEHIMALHKKNAGRRVVTAAVPSSGDVGDEWEDRAQSQTLEARLRERGEGFSPIPYQLLRTYIGYARKYVKPKLTAGAKKILQQYYLDLREKHKNDDNMTPLTTRQLESLIRLTEARAKAELRVDATSSDAKDAIEIFQGAIDNSIFTPPGSTVDYNASANQSGTRKSKARVMTQFVGLLTQEARQRGSGVFAFQELTQFARAKGFLTLVGDMHDFVDALNVQGFILKLSGGQYRLASF